MKNIAIGIQDFEKLRMKNIFYVDKTKLIREWWEKNDDVTLIARPRRFGKTLTVDMLEKFFSVQYAGRSDLFEGLEIWKDESYRNLQGSYPVVSLSFASIKEQTYTGAREGICQIIGDVYRQHSYLLESDALDGEGRRKFKEINTSMTDREAATALHMLCGYLYRYYGKRPIVLMDEYDTPMQEAYVNGYWDELTAFIRNLFNATFKTNPFLERGMMTGITRVSKESIFSDLNHVKVVTVTSEEYADCFGFTGQEVFAALEEYGLSGKKQDIKEWYDGFVFGGHKGIYNPWSIINFLDTGKLAAYWANTSSNSLVAKLIRESGKEIKQDFETLLKGGAIQVSMDEQIAYDQLSTQKSAIWGLLLAGGYLNAEKVEFSPHKGRFYYQLRLTNREVLYMFENMVNGWFADHTESYHDFIRAFLRDDLKEMNAYMNRIVMAMFSFFDSGTHPSEETQPERFYHGFVLGLLVELEDRYVLTSNRESGLGRYDVMLKPREKSDPAYILEFKVRDTGEEDGLSETVKSALSQIEDMRYAEALTAEGIPSGHIRKYGFAFQGKKVLIGRQAYTGDNPGK